MSFLNNLAYWNNKTPSDNLWHPLPGASSETTKQLEPRIPQWFTRLDFEAMSVDVAPFICGAGALAHLRQLPQMGFTAPASIFHNRRTLDAMFKTGGVGLVGVGLLMVAGVEYRFAIPRWAHEREKRRNERQVRELLMQGEVVGAGVYAVRLFRARRIGGVAGWRVVPLEIVFGIALADLAHREYYKAHGL